MSITTKQAQLMSAVEYLSKLDLAIAGDVVVKDRHGITKGMKALHRSKTAVEAYPNGMTLNRALTVQVSRDGEVIRDDEGLLEQIGWAAA